MKSLVECIRPALEHKVDNEKDMKYFLDFMMVYYGCEELLFGSEKVDEAIREYRKTGKLDC